MISYTERVNRLAKRPSKTYQEEAAWIELVAMLAATLTGAADNGHVTKAVHRQIEEHIETAEIKMNARP